MCKEGQVFELENAYICERSQSDKRACKFKIGKVIAMTIPVTARAIISSVRVTPRVSGSCLITVYPLLINTRTCW